jgi:hypothetical protein
MVRAWGFGVGFTLRLTLRVGLTAKARVKG